MLRGVWPPGRAGSRRQCPGWSRRDRRRAGLALTFEGLDDDHVPAAAWAWRAGVVRLDPRIDRDRRSDPEQLADVVEMRLAGGTREQAIVADAMEALRQDVEQEAPDELVGGERHDLLPVGTVGPVVLVAERDPGLVQADNPAVRDGTRWV